METEEPDIVANTRILRSPLTGVQRYTLELLSRFGDRVTQVAPRRKLDGVLGHTWEQFFLPSQVSRSLLWSPSNTGPLAVKRQVITIHDVVPMDHPEWLTSKFAIWYRLLLPGLAKRVTHIITVSEFTKQRVIETLRVPQEKISVIYNGVDSRFAPCPGEDTAKVRATLGLPSDRYMLSLGSLEPRKNLHSLLQAWDQVLPDLPQDLWLVVTGAKGKSLVFGNFSLEKLPPRVFLTGHVNDEYLPALYSGALLSAYLSLYEGFGLPPLEAMACGTPVVTSDTGAIPEVVGEAAIRVNPYDVEAIAWGIRHVLEDSVLRENLRRKGLERAKRFTWERTAKLTWEVLRDAAAR